MNSFRIAGALIALAGFTCAAQASIVNINAQVDPSISSSGAVASLTLGAGTYNISVVGVAGGGLYNGWTFATPIAGQAKPYRDAFSVSFGGTTTTYDVSTGSNVFSNYINFATAADALTAFTNPALGYVKSVNGSAFSNVSTVQLILASTQTVSFFVPDIQGGFPGFSDNTGGVSLAVTQNVPEPESIAMVFAGLGALAFTTRRRKSA